MGVRQAGAKRKLKLELRGRLRRPAGRTSGPLALTCCTGYAAAQMRLLDRYLLRELLLPLGYCLGGFLVFWIAFDLFNELPAFQQSRLHGGDVAEYYLVKLPELLITVLPVALLLALLYALTNHARHHELVAIRAAGVGLWRLSAPYLAVGFTASVLLFVLNEVAAPNGNELAADILNRYSANKAAATVWHQNLNFINEAAHRTWSIGAYNPKTAEMLKPNVEWRRPDGSRSQMFAERATRENGVWVFYNVLLFRYQPPDNLVDPLRFTTNVLAAPEFAETPRLIKSEIKINSMDSYRVAKKIRFTLAEIADYQRLHPQLQGRKRAELTTQFHGRLAAPWTCLVVVLVALPFGALTGRRNVFVGVAASVFIVFAFFILSRLGLVLGTSGYLPGWLAAWLPHLLFGGGGAWFTHRLR